MKRRLLVAALAVLGCGGSGGSFTGTVKGKTFAVKDAIFSEGTTSAGGTLGLVVLGDQEDLCTALSKGRSQPGASYLVTELFSVNEKGIPRDGGIQPGDYSVLPATTLLNSVQNQKVAESNFFALDTTCKPTDAGTAAAPTGSVTISTWDTSNGGSAKGNFDLNFNSGDEGKGDFTASYCNVTTQNVQTLPCVN